MQTEAFFLTDPAPQGGQRFCLLHHSPLVPQRGLVLYLHPFAEEMNKTRRMAALQARALARAGFTVMQIDLWGCGDSSGDFGQATWKRWVGDVVLATAYLRQLEQAQMATDSPAPLWLWGLRSGCLLAAEAAHRLDGPCNFLFWQAPASGKGQLQQFLRLKAAAGLVNDGAKGVVTQLRQQLKAGLPVEIAGYELSSRLASGLEQSALTPPASEGLAPRVEWFELTMQTNSTLSPISVKTIDDWQHAGYRCTNHLVNGMAFWQTSEMVEVESLIDATTAALCA